MSYVKRLRDLNKQLALEQDPAKRVEILERMLYLLDARSRARRAEESQPATGVQVANRKLVEVKSQ